MKQFHSSQGIFKMGTFQIVCDGQQIYSIELLTETASQRSGKPETISDSSVPCVLCRNAIKELSEYFSGNRKAFDLPLNPKGSRLQLAVWDFLRTIPYGQTVSYTQVAAGVGCRSIRAVATAVGQNPIPILIPCHRVIRKDGSIGEFSMGGPENKRFLLELERLHQVNL